MTLQETDLPVAWHPLVQPDDPYPVYRRLRDEAPLYHDDELDLWALSRFDDVQAAAKDWETYSTGVGGLGNDIDDTYQLFLPAGDLAGVDPPLHTRLRGALRLAFSPSALRPDSSRSFDGRSRSSSTSSPTRGTPTSRGSGETAARDDDVLVVRLSGSRPSAATRVV